jgi:D-alanyl-D-alanine carboxypeptidase
MTAVTTLTVESPSGFPRNLCPPAANVPAPAFGGKAVIAAPAAAVAAPEEPDRAGLQKKLDDVVAGYAVGAVAEVRDEHRVWRGTSGVAEVGTTRAIPVHGRFRAGSITKTFVATVVLQLVAEGRLRLDDTVETWLPDVVPNGDRITVRQLLNHTSGLYDYKNTLPVPPSQEFLNIRWRTWTADEQIQRAAAHPPTFEPPGSAYKYSNTNYLVLGEIIEKVTGQSYGEEIERRLIRPLRLRDTEVPGTSPWIRGPHPHGYVPIEQNGDKHLVDFTEMNPSLFGAGGEMISTTADLNRFFTALLGGRLLPAPLLDEMKTPGIEGGKKYGLGLAWRDTTCGIRLYGNDGDALAYQSWSFSTEDGHHQVTVALTPDFRGDPDNAVDAFLDKAICT